MNLTSPTPSPQQTSSGYFGDGFENWNLPEEMALTAVVLLVLGLGVAWLIARGVRSALRAERPWWGHPLLWVGISGLSVLLGIFVVPHFFGGVFLFLPFIWQRPRRDERSASRNRAVWSPRGGPSSPDPEVSSTPIRGSHAQTGVDRGEGA